MSQNSNTCPNTRDIIVYGRNPKERKAVFFNPPCGSWSCDVCWEQNREKWVHIAMKGTLELLEQGSMLQFITLTGRGYFTPTSSIYFMRQNFPKLRKRIQYHNDKWADVTGTKWGYLLIPERHKDGRAHWHLLASTWENRDRWWKDTAFECGFGYMAKVKPIENTGAAGAYVVKYMTKDAGGIAWPKGFRRARTSRNWSRPIESKPTDWLYDSVNEDTMWLEKNALLNLGWTVNDRTEKNG